MEQKLKRVIFPLPEDVYEKLVELAKQDSRSFSNFARKILTDYVEARCNNR